MVEGAARRRYGRHLTVSLLPGMFASEPPIGHEPILGPLIYRLDALDVRGEVLPVPVEIHFRPTLPSWVRDIRPEDYPSVYAERDAQSPHRLLDRGLCLYHPSDPPALRWTASMGLDVLLDMAAEHLYMERYWRANKHKWIGAEAPHGKAA
jgi:hypothetical protein